MPPGNPQGYSDLSSVLTSELDRDFYNALDRVFAVEEDKQLNRTLEGLNERGFLQSGQTLKNVSEEVLGPAQDRRRAAIAPLAREERQGEIRFQQERQLREEQFDRRLEEIQALLDSERETLRIKNDYARAGQGGGGFFGQVSRMLPAALAIGTANAVPGGFGALGGYALNYLGRDKRGNSTPGADEYGPYANYPRFDGMNDVRYGSNIDNWRPY